ncbi:unnamed protein product [marine sediment metagenome]|uniref:Uncharacterized protein n=1 Tax=marine sediment metagenome TaxID=412755 RepID=X1P8G9_9ZZZZ
MAVSEEIKKKTDVEKVVDILVAKANKPDPEPTPYCGGGVNLKEIEKITVQLKKEASKKAKLEGL